MLPKPKQLTGGMKDSSDSTGTIRQLDDKWDRINTVDNRDITRTSEMLEVDPRDTDSGIQRGIFVHDWWLRQILGDNRTKLEVFGNCAHSISDILNEFEWVELAVTCVHDVHMFLQKTTHPCSMNR